MHAPQALLREVWTAPGSREQLTRIMLPFNEADGLSDLVETLLSARDA